MSAETIIPLLPCKNFAETIEFYETLGFTVTHQQEEPYLYIAVTRGEIDLHFTGSLGVYGAKQPFGACLILVDGVSAYHCAFADGLRTKYGKVPTAELPRIARLRPGHTRFRLFDPNGNVLLFISRNEPAANYQEGGESQSPLAEALVNAEFLRDTYSNDKAAARALDLALERNPSAAPIERARALAARAELAVAMGDEARAQALQRELERIPLSDEEREDFREELQAAAVLAQWLIAPTPQP
jgi:catechol 2,3-dioxygenase-like lactoylglutathione lyase family enzyme